MTETRFDAFFESIIGETPAAAARREQNELRARFASIKAFYAPHVRAMCIRSDEWVIDAYAWDSRVGIQLTPIEFALWSDIRAVDAVMYPQFPVGPFFVDFGNPAARVAIECDGKRWHTDKEKDAHRDRALNAMGWTVYRISGRDCFTDTEESEDEYGRTVITLSTARRFVQDVCNKHPIQRKHAGSGRMIHVSEAVARGLDSIPTKDGDA